MSLAKAEANKSIEQKRIQKKNKPNLIPNKYSIYNQREEDGPFCNKERKDGEDIVKALCERACVVHLSKQEIP